MHQRLYLKVGDHVIHMRYPQWGQGNVVEVKRSMVAGGFCLVRILFGDGVERSFNNSLDDYACCYFSGLRVCSEAVNDERKKMRRGSSA